MGGDGWGLSYLDAVRVDYRYGEDGIAGLTTRDGAFDIGWALWDEQQGRVAERLYGLSNSAGAHGEAIVDHRTFNENTPTSSYARQTLGYPNADARFTIVLEEGRADDHSGVLRATATNGGAAAAPLHLLVKGWFHDPARQVEVVDGGLLLHGAGSVVAILTRDPSGTQAADRKRALDEALRAGGLSGTRGHIGAVDHLLQLAAGGTGMVRAAWAEATTPEAATARARELLGAVDGVLDARRVEAAGLFTGRVTDHEAVYRAALMGLLWNQTLYTWDGVSDYDLHWGGRVAANDVLILPDKWEFPWLATWDSAFQAVAAAQIDPKLGADQLRFLLSDRWQQPDGHLPCAEWVMGDECPPLFAWSALRVADAGAGTALLSDLYPALMRLYDYWWRAEAVQPRGLFTCGFCGMDNLPRGDRTAQADATGWMAMFARDLATIADRLGRADDAARLRTDRETIAAAINANLWSEERGFYFDLDDDGTFIPTRSYAGLVPLIAGVVPPDRQARVLAALRDPAAFLSPHGVRSVTADSVLYEPGYARAKGTNSNWRGPVWMPLNYLLVEALGDVDPQLAATIRERVVATVEADWTATGHFHEYFDADSGEGIGADAQTGWTALVANLIAQGWPSTASR